MSRSTKALLMMVNYREQRTGWNRRVNPENILMFQESSPMRGSWRLRILNNHARIQSCTSECQDILSWFEAIASDWKTKRFNSM